MLQIFRHLGFCLHSHDAQAKEQLLTSIERRKLLNNDLQEQVAKRKNRLDQDLAE